MAALGLGATIYGNGRHVMIWPALPFMFFLVGFAANAIIAIRMQIAVNEGAPKTERLSWYGMVGDATKIIRKHRLLFPHSHLRQWWYFSTVFLLAAFVLTGILMKIHKG